MCWPSPSLTLLACFPLTVALLAQDASSHVQFDIVSMKRNTSNALGSNSNTERPDGGLTLLNVPLNSLIARAYPGVRPIDMIGVPTWAGVTGGDRYDVIAKSSLGRAATTDERAAMMRAMLADRLKLAAHVESREQPAYDLVVVRGDKQLGPSIKPAEVDCVALTAAQRAAADAARAAGTVPPRPTMPDMKGPIPPCTFRMIGNRVEASATTIEALVQFLRPSAGRYVVDKTWLTGSYQVSLTFDRMAGLRGPDATSSADAAPSLFTALQEQLGLKLESSRATRDILVIDHIERPSEN